ncbi:hypothetical protein FQN55_004389 [Onygenales sp. PD_40]|nr:hypothetical protein FQN55_004389 [Onygenales sp. PD_40]
MAENVEILVHVSAPGTTKDDATYRAHADAYLDFEPVSRVCVYPGPLNDGVAADALSEARQNATVSTPPQHDSGIHSEDQISLLNTSETSFQPYLLSAQKSTPLPSTWGPSFGDTTFGILDAPNDSVIQKSFTQNDASAAAENTFSSFLIPPITPDPRPSKPRDIVCSSQASETPPSVVPESPSSFQASWNVEKDNSPLRNPVQFVQIGRSPSLDQSSQSKRQRLSLSPACIPSSIPEGTAPTSSISEPPPTSQSVPGQDLSLGTPYLGVREQTLEQPSSSPLEIGAARPAPSIPTSSIPELSSIPQLATQQDTPLENSPPDSRGGILARLSSLPLEINAPRPAPSSTAEFTTHITPTLQMLANQLKLSRVFKPSRQTRSLRALERGYWALNLSISTTASDETQPTTSSSSSSPWTAKRFFEFWDFLSKFIAHDGRAGWGVWCICDSNSPSLSSSSPARLTATATDTPTSIIDLTTQSPLHPNTNINTPTHPEPGDLTSLTVKIYTWGEVAPHIYLLMYLASDRKVKKVPGVQWRDGADEGVIFMD